MARLTFKNNTFLTIYDTFIFLFQKMFKNNAC